MTNNTDNPVLYHFFQHQLKLGQLVRVVAVNEHNSILHASKQLYITQPALTKSIHEVEKAINAKIFLRTSKGVVPTPIGGIFLKYARSVIAEVQSAATNLERLATGETGRVTLGVTVTMPCLLPRAIARLHNSFPSISVRVIQGTNEDLIPALRAGEIDTIVGEPPEEWEFGELRHTTLYNDEVIVVVNKNHPLLKKRDEIGYTDLLEFRWLLPLSGTVIRGVIDSTIADARLPMPSRTIEMMSSRIVKDALLQSDMVALLPRYAVRDEVSNGLLAEISLDIDSIQYPIGITTASDRRLTPGAESLCKHLSDTDGQPD